MYPFFFENTPYEIDAWYAMHFIGIVVALTAFIIKKPKDLPAGRPALFMLSLFLIYFGFIGAALFHAILYSGPFYAEMTFRKAISKGGGAYLGTLISSVLVLFAFTKFRIKRISFLAMADYCLPFILLEQAFGRIGCLLAGCCFGKPTTLPWACVFTDESMVPRHPTQIYYSIFLFVIFFATRCLYNRNPNKGVVFFSGTFLYGLFRFFGEFLRVDSPRVIGIITLAQVAMLFIAALSGLALAILLKIPRNNHPPVRL